MKLFNKALLFTLLSLPALQAKADTLNASLKTLLDQSNGAGIFLVAQSNGLVARSADKELAVLSAEKNAKAYQAELDLVWVLQQDKIGVIDLRGKDFKIIPLVDHIKLTHFMGITGIIEQELNDPKSVAKIYLQWNEHPILVTESDDEDAFNPELLDKEIEHAELVGEKWLTSQLNRKKNALTKAEAAPKLEVKKCEEDCGEAVKLDQNLVFYISDSTEGDDIHLTCSILDSAQKKTIESGISCGAVYVSKNHYAYPFKKDNKEQYKICDTKSHECKVHEGKLLGILGGTVANLEL